jgi:hypothetical protein
MPPAPKSNPPPRRKTPSRFLFKRHRYAGHRGSGAPDFARDEFRKGQHDDCGIHRSPLHARYRSAAPGTIHDALTRFAGGRGDCPSPPMRSPSEPNQDGMTPMVADTAR